MRLVRFVVAWLAALAMLLLELTCRVRWHADPRPELRRAGTVYAYAILHCHQGAGIMFGEKGSGTMVSRSADGDLVIPCIRVRGIVPVRGSSQKRGREKGGRAALEQLIDFVRRGSPALLTVDGPRGPRNHVSPGIARLAKESGATILILVPIPTRRWIFRGTWDRLQIPKPFSRTDVYFGPPLRCEDGESIESIRMRIEVAIAALEMKHDPDEAREGLKAAEKSRAKLARESAPVS